MNKSATREEIHAVRRQAGVWAWEDGAFVRFTGPDAAAWLQTQTTNDVLALESGQGHANAVLDRKGRVQAAFTLHRWEDEYWLITGRPQTAPLLEQLDAHLFIEEVTIADASDEVDHVLVQGPRTLPFFASLLEGPGTVGAALLPRQRHACQPIEFRGFQALAFDYSVTGEDGLLLVTETGQGPALADRLLEAGAEWGLRRIGPEAREVLRVEAGVPVYGQDYDSTYRLAETTLEREAVSYDKGCFLGQEVVARQRAYGSVKQALMGLVCENALEDAPAPDTALYAEGRKAGLIKSRVYSPIFERVLALAYLDKNHRAPGRIYGFSDSEGGQTFQAEVRVLPFREAESREERAQALYERALSYFQEDASDEDSTAIELLKEALALHPTYEDAYEVLGVILNRHGRVDEAIRYMKVLAQLNPDCIMAHTNLSVFYVAKGMIEEAEQEKAQAALLEMKQTREARKAEELAAEERRRIAREARERIGMFEEVLEIDPADPLATFGMGSAYMQLNDYESAIPYLQKATQLQSDYSAAFLNLGKCLEFLGQAGEARRVFRAGIEAATRKGDFMPMREMERRLKQLDAANESVAQG
ncbi:MAG: tetratricopeptide repeat protein [Candidatus Hydrogenedentota bacterium]